MSSYKFGIVLESPNDYLRRVDLSYMGFINRDEFKIQEDDEGRLFIIEDVNMYRTERLIGLLKDKEIDAHPVSIVRWKSLPEIGQKQ